MSNCFEQVKKVKIEFEDGSVSVCTLFGKNNLIFEQLNEEIKELKSLIQWQPIETAPDCDETEVLLYDNESGKRLVGKKVYKNENIKYLDWIETDKELKHAQTEYVSGEIYFNPTHWMPLPELPTL